VSLLPNPALQRLDSFPYVHRVADVMVAPVVVASIDATLQETVSRLQGDGVGSCIVVDGVGRAVGIVTERDVVDAVGRLGAAALSRPLSAFMSAPVQSIEPDALLYRAIARMDRRRLRHLAVLDSEGRPTGIVTARALLRLRAGRALAIGDAVEVAPDAAALRSVHDQLPDLARALRAEKVGACEVAQVLSAISRDITTRVAQLCERAMLADGSGAAPAPWCLLILGSAARGESLLAPDQDNALIVAPQGQDEIDGWFARFAERLNAMLDQAGIPLCKGGVMARHRPWRQTVSEWKATIEGWISHPEGQALLNVDIFYDAVPVAGNVALAAEVLDFARASARQALPFLRLLAEAGTSHRPPLGLLGGWRLDREGRLDLKLGGLLPIVASSRVMALKLGITAASTEERLRGAMGMQALGADNGLALEQARRDLVDVVLAQQLEDLHNGKSAGNRVDPRRLDRLRRASLKSALRQAGQTSTLVEDVLTLETRQK